MTTKYLIINKFDILRVVNKLLNPKILNYGEV